jgi:hypothetical protein
MLQSDRDTLTSGRAIFSDASGSVDGRLTLEDAQHAGESRIVEVATSELKKKGSGIAAKTKKEEYLMLAYSKIYALFSSTQLKMEEQIQSDDANKEITTEIDRYANSNSQNKMLMVASDMYLLAAHRRNTRDDPVRFQLTEEARKRLALYYAHRCLVLWYIARTRTKMGKENPLMFPFREFIIPALSLMQTGFVIPESDLGYRAIVVEPDDILRARCLDSTAKVAMRMQQQKSKAAECSSPSGFRRKKKKQKMSREVSMDSVATVMFSKRKKSQADKIRLNLEAALTQAIIKDHVSPESLGIHSVEFDAINVDQLELEAERVRRARSSTPK